MIVRSSIGGGLVASRPGRRPASEPVGGRLDQILVELLLERHDQRRKLARVGPFPGAELWIGSGDVHVLVPAEEAHQEPGLALTAPGLLPDLADQVLGKIVGQLLLGLLDELDEVARDAGLLLELAIGAVERALAGIEAALRHLPCLERAMEPLADPDLALRTDQHDADGGPVAVIGHARVASSSSSFNAATQPLMSSAEEGTAFLKLMKPWMLPSASRKMVGTPASTQVAA